LKADMKNKRKLVLIIDDKPDSLKAKDLLRQKEIEFVEYDIRKFAESCCGDLPTTESPSVFAPEGVFRGLRGVENISSPHQQPRKKKRRLGSNPRAHIGRAMYL